MHTNLDRFVIDRLKESKGDWQSIATKAGVSYSWLSKFSNGHIPNPGYVTLTRLHSVLCAPDLAAQQPTVEGQGA
jgi:transcriptional regulator with XRE-family HTH domain